MGGVAETSNVVSSSAEETAAAVVAVTDAEVVVPWAGLVVEVVAAADIDTGSVRAGHLTYEMKDSCENVGLVGATRLAVLLPEALERRLAMHPSCRTHFGFALLRCSAVDRWAPQVACWEAEEILTWAERDTPSFQQDRTHSSPTSGQEETGQGLDFFDAHRKER